ncbi:TetR/AcrR family transcriptional regulator [Streptomyces sp. NPDC097595]|uniref:TetR/AcrR family transcriptional regulator n=1 Tax=Streptomyces sp. NPDC097595 TaxID=3366090 RepID=UPI00380FBCDB
MAGRRTDTRERAQRVALQLFAEHGYEGTSLRMIAERLDITKAALYYHYKSKAEILAAVLGNFSTSVAELIDWGRQQPEGPGTRRELLRRYAELTASGITAAARLVQENEPSLQEQSLAAEVRGHVVTFFDLLAGPGVLTGGVSDPAASLRVRLAIAALHMAGDEAKHAQGGGEELLSAALDIACDLIDPPVNSAPEHTARFTAP